MISLGCYTTSLKSFQLDSSSSSSSSSDLVVVIVVVIVVVVVVVVGSTVELDGNSLFTV